MTVITDAEIVYRYLYDRAKEGDKFTAESLHNAMKAAGRKVTYSALTAFLTRALKREMVKVVGYGARKARIYQLIAKPTWEFGHKTIGSLPGRTIHKEPAIYDLPVDDTTMPITVQASAADDTPLQMPIPTAAMKFYDGEPVKRLTLSDLLINIAADVERLELKPEKQLSDFTTDELMAELKRRVR